MNYCPKCGNRLNDGDLFCSHCGSKLVEATNSYDKNDYYSNNYIQKRVSYTTPGASKVAFILSIIGLVLFTIEILLIGFEDDTFPVALFIVFFMIDCALAIASISTAIPGFVISKKYNLKSKISIAAFVLAIILVTLVMLLYVCLPSE